MGLWNLMPLHAEIVIRKTLKSAKLLSDQQRRSKSEKRLDIYRDDWKLHLKHAIDQQFSPKTRDKIKQMIDDSVNIPKRIINDISLVYQKEAKRAFISGEDDSAKEDENYKKVIAGIPTDIIMQEVNRLTNLLNETLVYIVPRNGKIEYDILTPDQVEVFQDDEDPTKPVAILFFQTSVDTVHDTAVRKIYWDVFGNHIIFDENDQEVERMVNPYKDPNNSERTILPFVIFHKNYPKCDIWERTSGDDLFSAAIQIGVLLTYLNYSLKTNSFKQSWMTGIRKKDVPASIVFDQLYPLMNPNTDGKFGTLDFTVEFEKMLNAIIGKIAMIANNWGLSLDNFKLTISAQSGFALRIKNFGLEKVVIEQKKFYRFYENELFQVTRIVNNTAFSKNKIKDEGNFVIDFADLLFPLDPEENRKQWGFDLKLGAKNILMYIMDVNPDIKDAKSAEAFLIENVRINKEVAGKAGIDIDSILDALLQTGGSAGGGSPQAEGESSPLI